VQIAPVANKDGLVAFVNCTVNKQFHFGNLALYTAPASPLGFRIVYPTKVLNNGTHIKIVFPINRETGAEMQRIIVEQYLKLIEKLTKGDGSHEQDPRFAKKLC
jgi:DNA-binding cell septation regulator SpoVG